ncbi:hypothetical protein BDV95DRAFT_603272 [Massariosphaeria phaeospora]|uniref:Nudix hydrolase domain-containing protein n=1 Tax=Massariosphaeria phaeospora TaxID=100035 RepID=A0A7C8IJI4_9PLEO|nr:hypothetical protein BDV95DRAFT_603272 [Massariosphaeria phaeospora]
MSSIKSREPPPIPRPSSSVLLISPTNQTLLLHRVHTSSSFPSAHVFPGGALSATHDGAIPPVDSPLRHRDGPAYRLAAVRETFEECGILLATSKLTGRLFTDVGDAEREAARKNVHAGTELFADVLERWGAVPDTEGLVPCSRWITPLGLPKRFSTMMYIYFLPVGSQSPTTRSPTSSSPDPDPDPDPRSTPADLGSASAPAIVIPHPTHDGGIEHTAARFLPAHSWLALARQNRIILFPPQFFLLHILSPYLSPRVTSPSSPPPSLSALQTERSRLLAFLAERSGAEPSFAEACVSPVVLGKGRDGSRTTVLGLASPGVEVGTGRSGFAEWVVMARFTGEGPRDVEVRRRAEVYDGDGGFGGKGSAVL